MGIANIIVALLVLHSGLQVTTASGVWTYWGENGPAHWSGVCSTGAKQSPININTEDTVKIDIGPLKFVRYDYAFEVKITNTGHSVQLQLEGLPVHLEGSSLPSTYILEQMHFHWGAEHTVDGIRDSLELHFVHYDNQYENVSMAAEHENGVAVVATLFELSDEDNIDLDPILKGVDSVSKWVGKNSVMMRRKIIPYLYIPKDHTTYYHYEGSLTTPGCQESVLWFVFTEKLTVSKKQVKFFKSIGTENGTLMMNYRPAQALGDRDVYLHLEGYSTAVAISSNLLITFCSFLLVRILQSMD